MPAAADDHAAHGRDVAEVATPGDGDVPLVGHDVVGRIGRHPAHARAEHREPGVRRVGADQLRLARDRRRDQVAAHVARRQAHRAQAGDLQMREVLADAAAQAQHLVDRRRDAGRCLVVGEILVDAVGEIRHRVQQRRGRAETTAPRTPPRRRTDARTATRRSSRTRRAASGSLGWRTQIAHGLPLRAARRRAAPAAAAARPRGATRRSTGGAAPAPRSTSCGCRSDPAAPPATTAPARPRAASCRQTGRSVSRGARCSR